MNINCSVKPFDNVKVRQAMNYAINHDEIIEFVEQGTAIRLRTIIPEGIWGRPSEFMKYEYNPEKAKQLLKEAGYPDGFSTTLTFSAERYGNFEPLSVYIQSYLNDVGIKTSLKKVAWPIQLADMKAAKHEITLNTWSPYYPDPAEFVPYFYNAEYYKMGSWNFSFWENSEATRMAIEAEQVMDQAKRAELYSQVEKIGVENAVYVYLYQMSNMMAMRDEVQGEIYHPTLWHKQFATDYKK
jgi:peptide/nickel transport system substrate-binding protein